jgi:hypothetical protein
VSEDDWRTTFRPDVPSSARIYDYFLGGKDNYPADRDAGEEIARILPGIREAAQVNRAFVRRAVRYLVGEAGLTQLIDIGPGLPTQGNVHEVAHNMCPATQVLYVDHDPIVLAHARDMLATENNVAIIARDMRDPEEILADEQLHELIDFEKPVGLLFVSMLHFLRDEDDPGGIIRRLLAPFPSGSYVALTHGTADVAPHVQDAANVYRQATTSMHVRSREHVRSLVAGMELVEPGLVWTPEWRPEPADPQMDRPSDSYYYALVARTAG